MGRGKGRGNNLPSIDVQLLELSDDTKDKAIRALKNLDARGQLHPIDGWEGDTLSGYLDLLGLNGREIELNKSANYMPGGKGASYQSSSPSQAM